MGSATSFRTDMNDGSTPIKYKAFSVKCNHCRRTTKMIEDISGISEGRLGELYKPFSDNIECEETVATVMFCDIKGFTDWCARNSPKTVFGLLSHFYQYVDLLKSKYDIKKVETQGDCYIAIALNSTNPNHVSNMVELGKRIVREVIAEIRNHHYWTVEDPATGQPVKQYWENFQCRVGIHTGLVMSGIIRGERSKLQYCGDTMNMSQRMESTCPPGSVQISTATMELLTYTDNFVKTQVNIKGKGVCTTHVFTPNNGRRSSRAISSPYSRKRALIVGEPIAVGFQEKRVIEESGEFKAEFGSFSAMKDNEFLTDYDVILINIDDVNKSLGQLSELQTGRSRSQSNARLVGTSVISLSPDTCKKFYDAGIDDIFVKDDGPHALNGMLQNST